MNKAQQLQDMFFKDLKSYNNTNFKTILTADLLNNVNSSTVNKSFSSVVTRYFIFKEKHAEEYTESEFNMLYFQLKIDLVSRYFSEYPDADASILTFFQSKMKDYSKRYSDAG